MNIGLYREIISKLNALSVEEAKAENVRNLMGTWSNRAYQRDIISVLCAFYAYMDEKNEYNFIHTIPDWQNFFRERFSSYFKIDKIKADFDDIIFTEKVTDIILKFADKETLKEFYEYAKLQNDFYMKNNNNKYKSYFELLESKCESMGIVEKTIEVDIPQIDSISESTDIYEVTEAIKELNPNAEIKLEGWEFGHPRMYSTISMDKLILPKGFYANEKNGITNKHNTKSGMYCSIDVVDMSMQQQPTNTQSNLMTAAVLNSNFQNAARAMETHRENVFAPAADALGVDKSTLVNMVGNSESYKIDDIDIAPELIGMLKSNDSKVASIPKGMYAIMKNRISEKKFLRNIELDFIKENGLTTLKLSKKDTIFDKIASTSKEVINKIKKSAKEKAKTAMDFGSSSIGTIKNAILNTSTIVKQKAKGIGKSAEKALYNTVVAAGAAQMEIQDFAADKKEQVSQKKDELASKTADKLRSFADRIEPSHDIVIEANQKVEPVVATVPNDVVKETQTYINTPKGRAKVVLRAATKAGEVSNKSKSDIIQELGIEFEYSEITRDFQYLKCLKVDGGNPIKLVAEKLMACKELGICAFAEFNGVIINNLNTATASEIVEQFENRFEALKQQENNLDSLSQEEKSRLHRIKRMKAKGQYISPEDLEFENLYVGKYENNMVLLLMDDCANFLNQRENKVSYSK